MNEIINELKKSAIALINEESYYNAITLLTAIDEIVITEKRKETK